MAPRTEHITENVNERVHIEPRRTGAPAIDLVRWGPVVAGAIIGVGVFALFNSLWLAFAYNNDNGWVSGNLSWFIGATAAAALLLAGLIAGFLAGVRGTAAGLVNGVTAWGLLFFLSLAAAIPGALNLTTRLGAGLQEGSSDSGGVLGTAGDGFAVESALWVSFWSLLIGLALAAVGGVIGGALRRPVVFPKQRDRSHS